MIYATDGIDGNAKFYDKSEGQIVWNVDCAVKGDTLIKCTHFGKSEKRRMFRFSFHTAFISRGQLILTIEDLDDVNTKKRNGFDEGYVINILFVDPKELKRFLPEHRDIEEEQLSQTYMTVFDQLSEKAPPTLNLELTKKETESEKLGEKVGNVKSVEPIFFRNGFPKDKEANISKEKELQEESVISYSYISNLKDSLEKEVTLNTSPKTTPKTTPTSTPRSPRIEPSIETKSSILIGDRASQSSEAKLLQQILPRGNLPPVEVKIANYRDRATTNGSKEGQNNLTRSTSNGSKDGQNNLSRSFSDSSTVVSKTNSGSNVTKKEETPKEEDINKQLADFTLKLEQEFTEAAKQKERQLQTIQTRVSKLGKNTSQYSLSPPSSPNLRSTDPKKNKCKIGYV